MFSTESQIVRARDVLRIFLAQWFTNFILAVGPFSFSTRRNLTAVSLHKTYKCSMALK